MLDPNVLGQAINTAVVDHMGQETLARISAQTQVSLLTQANDAQATEIEDLKRQLSVLQSPVPAEGQPAGDPPGSATGD